MVKQLNKVGREKFWRLGDDIKFEFKDSLYRDYIKPEKEAQCWAMFLGISISLEGGRQTWSWVGSPKMARLAGPG